MGPSKPAAEPSSLSPKFTLYTELKMMDLGDDVHDEFLDLTAVKSTTNKKAQVIWLDENGGAVVQFGKRPKL